jgi:CRP-like cAMP-binding protein
MIANFMNVSLSVIDCTLTPRAFMILIMFEKLFAETPGARLLAFDANAFVFRQGDATNFIFQVQEGAVALERTLADGSLLTIAKANAGETFAEASLFSSHYHCDATARLRSTLLAIPSAQVRERLNNDPELARALAEFLARQVRDLRARLELQRIKRAPDRLMAWLAMRAQGNPLVVNAPDTWSRVASEIGLTPEATYRALSALERDARIERDGRQIVLRRADRT